MRSHLLKTSHIVLARPITKFAPLPANPIRGADESKLSLNLDDLAPLLSGKRDPSSYVIHIQPQGATVEDRDKLADRLRGLVGANKLAKQLKQAIPPRGHALVLIDTEEMTELRSIPISSLTPPDEVL